MLHKVPLVIVGASLGGVLAAWRAASSLPRAEGAATAPVWLVAEHAWIGGQMTAQAVPPDEHPLIEFAGSASASYRQFRADIRSTYRAMPGFVDISRMTPGLTNPGDGWVSRLCFEPARAATWFERLLAPLQSQGRLRLLRLARPIAARRESRRIAELALREADGRIVWIEPGLVVDASDTGELLRLANLPWRIGKESQAEFNEPDAPEAADPHDQQPVTHVLALRRMPSPGPLVEVDPESYRFWCTQRLPHYAHALFSEQMPGRGRGVSAQLPLQAADTSLDWWRYRRVVCAAQWPALGPRARLDTTLVNWSQNDYALEPLLDGPLPQPKVERRARELSRCLLRWLQTEAPRGDGGRGFPEWQPATELLGTADGFAQAVYVRESRRIVALQTLTQHDLHQPPTNRDDAGCIGWYSLDIHPTCRSGHGLNAAVEPFVIPLGAWVPRDADNLIAGCKNLGVTHLANACTRVHPIEWAVGEVAGLIAASSLANGHTPAHNVSDPTLRRELQATIDRAAIPRAWTPTLLAKRPAPH
jgi:FAD dependent oxidoreductase